MKANTAQELIDGIDWKQLKEQKQALLKAMDTVDSETEDSLNGILTLIDNIQDYAVDKMGIDENEVFHFPDEGE